MVSLCSYSREVNVYQFVADFSCIMDIVILRYFLWREERSFCVGLSIFTQGKGSYPVTGLDRILGLQ